MNYNDVINELTSKGMFYVDLGLDRIKTVLNEFNDPQDFLKCIHVAGTNGKGSVCAILNYILQEAGYKVGLYTSPHIFDYTERIKINNKDISKEDFATYYNKIKSVQAKLNVHLTEFEMLTIIMFMYFKDNDVDIVVLETGMGGRFDATNVIKQNLCSIITQIDLDHTDRLGKTREEIAYEKAGIIKPNCPVITSMGYEVIKDRADELNSMMIFTSPYVDKVYTELLALKGLHQAENLALAMACLNYLYPQITDDIIKRALPKVKNPYRFEYFEDKNLVIDVAHNPNGIQALRNNLDYYYPNQKRRFIFGCLKTKDYEQMMKILFKEDDEIYLNEFDYPKACSYQELKEKCQYVSKKYSPEVKLTTNKLNIICGSFYMLSGLLN